jgi:hypothetical protein
VRSIRRTESAHAGLGATMPGRGATYCTIGIASRSLSEVLRSQKRIVRVPMGTSAEQPGDIYAIRFRPAECQCQTSKKDIRSRGRTPAGPASIVRGRIRKLLRHCRRVHRPQTTLWDKRRNLWVGQNIWSVSVSSILRSKAVDGRTRRTLGRIAEGDARAC